MDSCYPWFPGHTCLLWCPGDLTISSLNIIPDYIQVQLTYGFNHLEFGPGLACNANVILVVPYNCAFVVVITQTYEYRPSLSMLWPN